MADLYPIADGREAAWDDANGPDDMGQARSSANGGWTSSGRCLKFDSGLVRTNPPNVANHAASSWQLCVQTARYLAGFDRRSLELMFSRGRTRLVASGPELSPQILDPGDQALACNRGADVRCVRRPGRLSFMACWPKHRLSPSDTSLESSRESPESQGKNQSSSRDELATQK